MSTNLVTVQIIAADTTQVVRTYPAVPATAATLSSIIDWVVERRGRKAFAMWEGQNRAVLNRALLARYEKRFQQAQAVEAAKIVRATVDYSPIRMDAPMDWNGVQVARFVPRFPQRRSTQSAYYFVSDNVEPSDLMVANNYAPQGYGPGAIRPVTFADGAPEWAHYVVSHSTYCD